MPNLHQTVRSIINTALGKEYRPKLDTVISHERFGSEYGGWDVIVEMLNADSVVYSFGVGEDATFDIGLIERFGLSIHAFDPTPKSIAWVERQNFPPQFVLHPFGISNFDGTISFNPPENPDHVSYTILDRPETAGNAIEVPVKCLETIIQELGHKHIDLLKMDIEGAEYAVIDALTGSSIRPRQLLVEFHHRFPNVGLRKTKDAVNTLRAMGYRLFSFSPSCEEFGFLFSESHGRTRP